jgi:isoprenylcysteine carboxyl methyltransferase (ICMT) family protein YpbQ
MHQTWNTKTLINEVKKVQAITVWKYIINPTYFLQIESQLS